MIPSLKKNAPEDWNWWLEEDTFSRWGEAFFQGQTRCFQGVEFWEFTPLFELVKTLEVQRNHQSFFSQVFDRKNFGYETVTRNLSAAKYAQCSTGLWFWLLTKKNTVDGCIKPRKKEWYEVPINWYRISTINNSINKENCSKVGALSETLVTNATSVLTCSNGHF